jgi:hypothetical protein
MPEPHPTAGRGRTFAIPADSPEALRLRGLLVAHWRAGPNAKGADVRRGPLWGVCPICREEALGAGSWPDGTLRVSCWSCGALEEDVAAALGVPVPDSRAGMLARLDRVIAVLDRQVGHLAERARPARGLTRRLGRRLGGAR